MVLLALLGLALPTVAALGVTSPFWDSNPLIMYPGETQEFDLVLQNMVGNRDFSVKSAVEEGAEFAAFVNENTIYPLPFGKDDLKIRVKISIPPDARPLEQKIGVSFTEIVEPEAGNMVQLGGAVKTYIPLVIPSGERASGASTGNLSLVLGTTVGKVSLTLVALLVIASLIYLFARKKE